MVFTVPFKGTCNIFNEENSSRVKNALKLMEIATNAWGYFTTAMLVYVHQIQFLSSVAQGGEDDEEI